MKHVTIEGASLPQHNKVLVKITAQTHVGYAFGNDFFDSRKFRASNGVVLGSNLYPALDKTDKNTFWVQGRGNAKQQSTTVVVPRSLFNRILVAADEYNKLFADKATTCFSNGSCVQTVG